MATTNLYVLAPASVQEMSDFVSDAFDMAFKYRAPVMILSDGYDRTDHGEGCSEGPQETRFTDEEIAEVSGDWATIGRTRKRSEISSHHFTWKPERMEQTC